MMSDYGVGALGGVVLIDPETGLPYKAEGGEGGGGGASLESEDGDVTATAEDGGTFNVTAVTGSEQGVFRVLNVGGYYSALLTDEDTNPMDSSWSPAGIVVHADLDMRVPAPPATGTHTLTSVDGVVSWVEA